MILPSNIRTIGTIRIIQLELLVLILLELLNMYSGCLSFRQPAAQDLQIHLQRLLRGKQHLPAWPVGTEAGVNDVDSRCNSAHIIYIYT